MTAVSSACLILALAALALCSAAWYKRSSPHTSDEPNQTDRRRFRNFLAHTALLCATFSASVYVAFLLSWVLSPHFLNGRQPIGAAAIWLGSISAVYAIVGGLFARGAQRLLIVLSSMVV